MAKKKLGVMVRGAGWVSGEHIKAYLKNPNTDLKVIDARFEWEIDEKFRKYGFECEKSIDRYEEQLKRDDIDVVSVCTINHLHAREAILAAEAGKHVFIEKPAAINLEDMKAVRDAINKAGVKSAVGFVVHWYETIKSMKAQIDKGNLGELYYVGAGYFHQVFGEWKGKRDMGGSTFLMGGCHAVDLVRWLSGKEIKQVMAYGTGPHNRPDFEYPPTVEVTVKYDDGTIGRLSSALEANMPYVFAVEVLGTRGGIKDGQMYTLDFPGAKAFFDIPGKTPDSPDVEHHPFDDELDEFIDCILEDGEMDTNINDAYRTHEVIFAIERSIESGEPVSLPLE